MQKFLIKRSILLLCLFLFTLMANAQGNYFQLIGGTEQERDTLSTVVYKIISTCKNSYYKNTNLDKIKKYFVSKAFISFNEEVQKKYFYPEVGRYKGILIKSPKGDFEIHNLNMKLSNPSKNALIPHKHITFIFNDRYKVQDFYFAPEKHHFQDVLLFGKEENRKEIISIINRELKNLENAYKTKNIQYFEEHFSSGILIISGFLPEASYKDQIMNFVHHSKGHYLKRLKEIFAKSENISIKFSDIKIKAHPFAHKIVGVHLKQTWKSDFYSDAGYLFLMFDFFDLTKLKIHIRIWQPEKFK